MNLRRLLILLLLVFSTTAQAQITRVQFINNCADQSFQSLDIYINATFVDPPAIDDMFFRESTPFMDVLTQSGTVEIGIAHQTSLDVTDTFYSRTMTLSPSNTYIIVLDGIESASGYSPAQPFALHIYNAAKQISPPGMTDVIFINGATDAPPMDLRTGITTMADDIAYGNFSEYTQWSDTNDYKYRLTNPSGSQTTHLYDALYKTIGGFSGTPVVVVASGFMNPSANSNGPDFGLWMATLGGGQMIELPTTNIGERLARMQIIHNCPDTAAGTVDMYIDNNKVVDTLGYRQATTYLDAFALTTFNLGFAQADSPNQFFNMNLALDSGEVYSIVFNGAQSNGYKPQRTRTLHQFKGAREAGTTSGSTDILLMHGSTDAPVTQARDIGSSLIPQSAGMNYGDFSSGYHTTNTHEVFRVDTGANNTLLEKYEAKLDQWNIHDKSITVVYSGFIVPDSNISGPTFGLWAALPEGGDMIELPVYVNIEELNTSSTNIVLWPNPAQNLLRFTLPAEKADIIITDISGKVMQQSFGHTDNKLNIADMAPGTYLLFMQIGDTIYSSKFIKQ